MAICRGGVVLEGTPHAALKRSRPAADGHLAPRHLRVGSNPGRGPAQPERLGLRPTDVGGTTRGITGATTRLDIQGLRALAVGLVVLDHAGVTALAGGFVGVDVFFVVSGFLITSLLLREAQRTGTVRIGAFYARRARRILPAATVVLVVTTLVAVVWLPVQRTREVSVDALWSALFAANLHFGRVGTDYFAAEQPPSPLQHFWSLGVEEQFYLAWPLLVLAGTWWAGRGSARSLRPLTAAAVAAVAASFWWSLRLTAEQPEAAYFSTAARAWELGVGVLLALLTTGHAVPTRGRAPLAAAGLAAIAAAALGFGQATPFPGWAAALPVLGTAAVLVAGSNAAAAGPARLLTTRPMTWLGDVSYPVYLWHWPLLLLGRGRLPVAPAVETVVLVVGALALAAVSHHLVEAPFRTGSFWRPTRRSLILWPIALATTLAAVGVAHVHTTRVTDRLTAADEAFDPASVPQELRTAPTGNRIHDAIAASLDRAAVGGPIPFPLRNDLTDLDRDRPWYGDGCVAEDPDVSHEVCPVGAVGAQRRIVVVGDSHALMWVPALELLGEDQGFEVVPLIKFGCTPFDLAQRIDPGEGAFEACTDYRGWVLEQIAELRPERVLVSSRAYPGASMLGDSSGPAWTGAVQRFVEAVQARGPVVTVLGDVSLLATDPARCLLADGATMADCTLPMHPGVRALNQAVRRGARRAGATYADVNRLVCVEGRCPFVVDRVVTYHDGQHISRTWARRVAVELGRMLELEVSTTAIAAAGDSPAPGRPG